MCWLRGKSALPLINSSVKVVNSCVKNDMDLNNSESKVVVSRHFFLSESLYNYWHNIVLKGVIMKPPNDIKYLSVEFNLFIKSPIHMKGCIVMIYIQVHISGFGKSINIQFSNGDCL